MANLKKRYASDFMELLESTDNFEADLAHAILIRDMLDSADVQMFITQPHASDKKKVQLFDDAFTGKAAAYLARLNKKLGSIEAKVVSAVELTEEQITAISTVLSKQTGIQIQLNCVVDPDVIGGFYILLNGRIFDGTVRSELNTMKERLKRGSYA